MSSRASSRLANRRFGAAVAALLLASATAGLFWHLFNLSNRMVRTMAIQDARRFARALEEFRGIYASEVVDRVVPLGIDVTHDYRDRTGAIPLPATLSVMLGNRIGQTAGEGRARLFSEYPFPWRRDGGPRDDFERAALRELARAPERPFFRFEAMEGKQALRYAIADRMREACVTCHNHHPASPKRDWKVGDVRGVLEVDVSLQPAIDEIRAGMWRTFAVFGASGAFVALFIGFAVHRIRRGGEALAASEHKFGAVAETARDAIVTADAAGDITYFNRAAEGMFGYAAPEVLGHPLTLLMPERFHAAHQQGLQRFLRTGETRVIGRPVEVAGRSKSGEEFPIELSIATWETDEGRFFSGILRNISERKRAEEALARQAEDLARSNRDLEQFAYVASHDLQEPLRAVGGFTQLLAKRYGDKLDETGRQFVAFTVDGVERMKSLIDDLLAYSRVGARDARREPVGLDAVFAEVTANLRAAIEESGVEIQHEALPTVTGDRAQLTQLLQNLLGNAIKFRRADPPHVRVAARRSGDEWTISVTDDGIGIEAQYLERVFQIFQRLHGPGVYPGTGIGLAICKKIAERHGGRIWVESRPGEGSTFSFSLPAAGP